MSVIISNVSTHDDLEGSNQYEIRIRGKLIASFDHKRSDGLYWCLKRAADAAALASLREKP